MAQSPKQLKNLKNFPKGVSGNPLGAGHPNYERTSSIMKRLTAREVKDLSGLILNGDIEQLQAIARNKKEKVIKVMLASVAVKIISKGDAGALNILLDRLIGKVPNPIRLGNTDGTPIADVVRVNVNLPSNGREIK